MFLEPVEADPSALDPAEAVRVVEDYKPLDVQSATMALALLRGIRARYPEWRHVADGDGGDENLKDYPIEENSELTIRSVVSNPMLYQEGWGVGPAQALADLHGRPEPLVHAHVRAAAALRVRGLLAVHEPEARRGRGGDPFDALTRGDVARLYALKGEVVARGMLAVTG
jgi:asparagine synthase (glutamine-hydrolysing)